MSEPYFQQERERFIISWLDKLDDLFSENYKFSKTLIEQVGKAQLQIEKVNEMLRNSENELLELKKNGFNHPVMNESDFQLEVKEVFPQNKTNPSQNQKDQDLSRFARESELSSLSKLSKSMSSPHHNLYTTHQNDNLLHKPNQNSNQQIHDSVQLTHLNLNNLNSLKQSSTDPELYTQLEERHLKMQQQCKEMVQKCSELQSSIKKSCQDIKEDKLKKFGALNVDPELHKSSLDLTADLTRSISQVISHVTHLSNAVRYTSKNTVNTTIHFESSKNKQEYETLSAGEDTIAELSESQNSQQVQNELNFGYLESQQTDLMSLGSESKLNHDLQTPQNNRENQKNQGPNQGQNWQNVVNISTTDLKKYLALEKRGEELTQRVNKLETELKSMENLNVDFRLKNSELQDEIERLKIKNQDCKAKISKLQEAELLNKERTESLKKELEYSQGEIQKLSTTEAQNMDKIGSLNNEIGNLQLQVKDMTAELETFDSLKEVNRALEKKIIDLGMKNMRSRSQEKSNSVSKSTKSRTQRLSSSTTATVTKKMQTIESSEKIESMASEMEKLKKKVSKFENKQKNLNTRNGQLRDEIERVCLENLDLKAKIQELKKALSKAQKELDFEKERNLDQEMEFKDAIELVKLRSAKKEYLSQAEKTQELQDSQEVGEDGEPLVFLQQPFLLSKEEDIDQIPSNNINSVNQIKSTNASPKNPRHLNNRLSTPNHLNHKQNQYEISKNSKEKIAKMTQMARTFKSQSNNSDKQLYDYSKFSLKSNSYVGSNGKNPYGSIHKDTLRKNLELDFSKNIKSVSDLQFKELKNTAQWVSNIEQEEDEDLADPNFENLDHSHRSSRSEKSYGSGRSECRDEEVVGTLCRPQIPHLEQKMQKKVSQGELRYVGSRSLSRDQPRSRSISRNRKNPNIPEKTTQNTQPQLEKYGTLRKESTIPSHIQLPNQRFNYSSSNVIFNQNLAHQGQLSTNRYNSHVNSKFTSLKDPAISPINEKMDQKATLQHSIRSSRNQYHRQESAKEINQENHIVVIPTTPTNTDAKISDSLTRRSPNAFASGDKLTEKPMNPSPVHQDIVRHDREKTRPRVTHESLQIANIINQDNFNSRRMRVTNYIRREKSKDSTVTTRKGQTKGDHSGYRKEDESSIHVLDNLRESGRDQTFQSRVGTARNAYRQRSYSTRTRGGSLDYNNNSKNPTKKLTPNKPDQNPLSQRKDNNEININDLGLPKNSISPSTIAIEPRNRFTSLNNTQERPLNEKNNRPLKYSRRPLANSAVYTSKILRTSLEAPLNYQKKPTYDFNSDSNSHYNRLIYKNKLKSLSKSFHFREEMREAPGLKESKMHNNDEYEHVMRKTIDLTKYTGKENQKQNKDQTIESKTLNTILNERKRIYLPTRQIYSQNFRDSRGSITSKIIDYLEDEFKDCLRRSSKKTGNQSRNCALLFEVKMDSKKLNKEPILHSLLQNFSNNREELTQSDIQKLQEELKYVKELDLQM